MKYYGRRLIALAMLLSSLLSMLVPATFAEDPATETIVYDFALYNNPDLQAFDAGDGDVDIAGKKFNAYSVKPDGSTRLYNWFFTKNAYPNSINWRPEASNGYYDTKDGENFGNEMKNFNFRGDTGAGMELNLVTSQQIAEGQLAAIRIQVPTAGAYAVSLLSGSNCKTELYIFPAASNQLSATYRMTDLATDSAYHITPNLTETNLVGSAALTDGAVQTVGSYTFPAGGDYIAVFRIPQGGTKDITLKQMTLTAAADPQETTEAATTTEATTVVTTTETTAPTVTATQIYDFQLYNNQNLLSQSSAIAGANSNGYTKFDGTNRLYNWFYGGSGAFAAGIINWRPEASNGYYDIETDNTGNEMKNFAFRGEKDEGMALGLVSDQAVAGQMAAIRIDVPVVGEYGVKLTAGAKDSRASVYIFPAITTGASINSRMTDLQTDAANRISTYLTEENRVGTVALAKEATVKVGSYTFPTAGAYIVVFQIPEDGTKDIYLRQMTLVPGEEDVEETTAPNETTEATVPTTENIPPVLSGSVFNMALYTDRAYKDMFLNEETHQLQNKSYIKACGICGKRLELCLNQMYARGEVNWKLEGHSDGFEKSNIIFRAGSNEGLRGEAVSGQWVAFRLNVGVTGTYNVNIASLMAYAYTADIYLFPAEPEAMTAQQLEGAMTAENYLGLAQTSKTVLSGTVGQREITAGEYILAVQLKNSTRFYLGEISLTEPVEAQPKPVGETVIYDFDLMAKDQRLDGKFFTENYHAPDGTKINTATIVNQMQADGLINWNYENKSENLYTGGTDFRRNCYRFKMSPDVREKPGQWLAFRLDNPGTATYDIRAICSDKGNLMADIYLIPAKSPFKMSAQEIEGAMTPENLVRSDFYFKNEGENYIGEYTFGTEDHYILVLCLKKGARAFMSQIKMTVDGKLADPAVETKKTYNGTVYDLDLADEFDGIYYEKSSYYMPDVLGDMNARWNSGKMNWKFLYASEELMGQTVATRDTPGNSIRFYRASGLRVYGKKDYWIALKIKSPGSGDFTLSINHATCQNSGTVALYVLPGDTATEDIWAATDPANRVGKAVLTNKTGAAVVEDGAAAYLGYWSFEAGKEYILVLECYEASTYNASRSYFNISQIIMERGRLDYEAREQKQIRSVTVLDEAIPVADAAPFGAVSEVNGHDYFYLPLEGGYMLVYDLDTRQLVDKIYTGHTRSTCAAVGPDGRVYAAYSDLVIYDPDTGESEITPKIKNFPGLEALQNVSGMAIAEDGTIWCGGNYGGYLFSYNTTTKEFTSYGMPFGYQNRMTGMVVRNGYVYGCIHGEGFNKIFKWEIATQSVVAVQDVQDIMGTAAYIHTLNFLGDDYLVPGGSNLAGALLLDIDTLERVENNLYSYPNMGVSEEIQGKHYLVLQGYGLYQYDIATREFSKVPGFGTDGLGFRTGAQSSFGKSLVTIDGDLCLFTYATGAGGNPRFYNLSTQEYMSWDDLVVHGSGGSEIRGFINGEAGSNQIYFGAFNNPLCAVYNTELGQVEYYYKTGGQTDSQILYEGKLYTGNYSSTTLNEIYPNKEDTSLPTTNELIQRWRLDHAETGQKRIHTLAAGDGYVFAGTMPDSNLLGGAVVVYDTRTGRWNYHRNAIENQSVEGLTFSAGTLYGSTSTKGGSGAVEDPNASAVIFVYDYKQMQVEAVLDPRDYISGFPSRIQLISHLKADPVVQDRIWAVISETLFCFTYHKESKTFRVQEVLSFSKTYYADTFVKNILFDTDRNILYVSFGTGGGMQRIQLEDWDADVGSVKVQENARIMDQIPDHYVLGEDGNIYFQNRADTGDLNMYPLNVTEEDWAIAAAVDKMVTDLGEITLESEAAIKSARSAYENLGWRYKALIQNLEKLQEAESDILECKIDALVLESITADSYPDMVALMEEYKALGDRQQRYVKNYSLLKEAYDKASDLNDQRIAKEMQARVDALQSKFPLTLDHEPEVVAIRTDYKALTGKQAQLVDTAVLEEAEAQIAVLRAELVKYVETLIQAIPDEITLDAEPAITAAREGADKLYTVERKEISYSKLTSAEGKLRTLKKAKAAAEEVDALIDAIGIVTLGDEERIHKAREAYDALNGTAREFVTKLKKLEQAQWLLKALQTWMIPTVVIVVAGAAFCVVWFIPSLHNKVFKPKKKETEEI